MLLSILPVMIAAAAVAVPAAPAVDHSMHTASARPPAVKVAAEKKICKRSGTSESRMGSKRICKTAAQWRRSEGESTDGDRAGLSSKQ